MDPDAALNRLRAISKAAMLTAQITKPDDVAQAALVEAAEIFAGLDRWISAGGFLPKDWRA